MSRRTLCGVALAGLTVLAAGPAVRAQTAKIGVFDAQRVSEETEEGKRVQVELTTFRDGKQKEISAKQEAISELQKQLSQQALSLSAERRTALEKDIQKHMLELQTLTDAAGRELQLEVAAAQSGFQAKLEAAVASFAKDQGFDLILDRGMIVWMNPSVDVTTAIVDRFNGMFPPQAEKPGK
jgi:outer membrane protein